MELNFYWQDYEGKSAGTVEFVSGVDSINVNDIMWHKLTVNVYPPLREQSLWVVFSYGTQLIPMESITNELLLSADRNKGEIFIPSEVLRTRGTWEMQLLVRYAKDGNITMQKASETVEFRVDNGLPLNGLGELPATNATVSSLYSDAQMAVEDAECARDKAEEFAQEAGKSAEMAQEAAKNAADEILGEVVTQEELENVSNKIETFKNNVLMPGQLDTVQRAHKDSMGNVIGEVYATKAGDLSTLRTELLSAIESISGLRLTVVNTLPTENIDTKSIYLVQGKDSSEQNVYDEYIYTGGVWEIIGTTKIDWTNYYKKPEVEEKVENAHKIKRWY